MRSTLRSLVLSAAALLALTAQAQQLGILVVSGSVVDCTPGQMVSLDLVDSTNTSIVSSSIPVDNNCHFSGTFTTTQSGPFLLYLATECNGSVLQMVDNVEFNNPIDTVSTGTTFHCTMNEPLDCDGIPNGQAMPGTVCETFPGSGIMGTLTPGCSCDTTGLSTVDCTGVLGGTSLPGTPCNDGDPWTTQDMWTANCNCVGSSGPNLHHLVVTGTDYGCDTLGAAACEVLLWDSLGNLINVWNTALQVDNTTCTFSGTAPFAINGADSISYLVLYDYSWGCGMTETGSLMIALTDSITSLVVEFSPCGPVPPNDCLGVPGGTALPGTPCNDGDPMTVNDTWDANCTCAGVQQSNCQADFMVQQTAPWQIATTDLSVGAPPITYSWWLPDGSTSTLAEPTYTFSQAGIYGICLTITADSGSCTSTMCDTVVIDSNGMISNSPVWYDCLGVLWGPDVPGAPCNDGDSLTVQDTWSMNCACVGIPLNAYDCLGILNGPDMPGTPCDDGNPATTNDMWDANCTCVGTNNAPCQADFWVIQAYTVDSLLGPIPIPNELWLWNLSSGGSGTYSYLWDFGDGSSSTDPFPTHNYAGSGPYVLCLTIDDGLNCISTHCDTVAIDSNGIYTGMVVFGNGVRSSTGFILNVQNPGTNGLEETLFVGEPTVWPNPVNDQLNVAFELQHAGRTEIMVLDMQGRVLLNEAGHFGSGASLLRLPTATLSPGLYTLRLSNGTATTAVRFVKVD